MILWYRIFVVPTQQSTYDIQVKIISAQFFRLIFLLQILKNKQNKKALLLFFMDLLFLFQIILESLKQRIIVKPSVQINLVLSFNSGIQRATTAAVVLLVTRQWGGHRPHMNNGNWPDSKHETKSLSSLLLLTLRPTKLATILNRNRNLCLPSYAFLLNINHYH